MLLKIYLSYVIFCCSQYLGIGQIFGEDIQNLTKMAISPNREILNEQEEFKKSQEQFKKSQKQLSTMMTQSFNHQLEIFQEGKNLKTNSMDNIVNGL